MRKMAEINGSGVGFYYKNNNYVLRNADFTIEPGKMTAILGKNGCGKSTLVKLITALLPLSEGTITIHGKDIREAEGVRTVRKHCGIVFQNPDNQFVSPVIEDDIKFGLSNHQVPEPEQAGRIREALEAVDLSGFEKRSIHTLSGGQKQRAASAGILALRSDILIFDEAASMLDPEGKAELVKCIEKQRDLGKTIIVITQNITDIIHADRILLMAEGKIIAGGTPREILTDIGLLECAGLRAPFPVRVFDDLRNEGILLPFCPITPEELAEAVCSYH